MRKKFAKSQRQCKVPNRLSVVWFGCIKNQGMNENSANVENVLTGGCSYDSAVKSCPYPYPCGHFTQNFFLTSLSIWEGLGRWNWKDSKLSIRRFKVTKRVLMSITI